MSSSKLSHIGGYEINKMLILPFMNGEGEDPIDPRENMAELNVYEDIETNSLASELILEENSGLEDDLEERDILVYVNISTPGEEEALQTVFYVYAIERKPIAERHVALVMHMTSLENAKNNVARVNKIIGDKPMLEEISALLKNPVPNGLEVNDIEEALPNNAPINPKPLITNSAPANQVNLSSNKWRPFRCINYMASRALSDSGSASYVFFERFDGFMLLNVYDGFVAATENPEKLRSYFYKPGRTEGHEPGDDANQRYSQVLEYSRFDDANELDNSLSGSYGSNLNHLNLLTKDYTEWEFDPEQQTMYASTVSDGKKSVVWRDNEKNIKESKPVRTAYGVPIQRGKQKLFVDGDEKFDQRKFSRVSSQSFATTNGHSLKVEDEHAPQRWLQSRVQFLAELEMLHFQISSYGKVTYHAGQYVKLHIPARRPLKEDDTAENILDQRESGIYLVSKIRHHFTPSDHYVHMDLVRDAYSSSEFLGTKGFEWANVGLA